MLDIDAFIKHAYKNKLSLELKTYKNIKAKIQEYKTSKNAEPYSDKIQVQILKKMCDSLKESEKLYEMAGREDLFVECMMERGVIEQFLPKPATAEEIELAIKESEHFIDGKIAKKSMGLVVKEVKSKFDLVDGKLVADIVKSFI